MKSKYGDKNNNNSTHVLRNWKWPIKKTHDEVLDFKNKEIASQSFVIIDNAGD